MTRLTSITPNRIVRDTDDAMAARVTVTMPLTTQFYDMREFAIVDPDGHVMTFAERVG